MTEPGELPSGCGYQGYEFGAGRYPDSQCFGGHLYDTDNCESGGLIYEPSEHLACPICQPREAIHNYKENNLMASYRNKRGDICREYSKRDAARWARHLVRDIQKNRRNGTEPWKS